MASEEERAAILAEYKAAASLHSPGEDDEDDEADFDPCDSDSGDSSPGEEEDDDDDDIEEEEEEKEKDYVVLTGSIHLNEEGRVIYSGTWCMNSELEKANTALSKSDGQEDENGNDKSISSEGGDGNTSNNSKSLHHKHKKHPKFKLRSQDICHPWPSSLNGESSQPQSTNGGDVNSNGHVCPKKRPKALFDVHRPTLSEFPSSEASTETKLPDRRTMIFDGFFFEALPPAPSSSTSSDNNTGNSPSKDGNDEKQHHHGKKVRERDVEIFFSIASNEDDVVEENDEKKESPLSSPKYQISGRGYNDYGPFVLDGTYTTSSAPSATIICRKTYGVGGEAKETRGSKAAASSGAAKGAKRSRRAKYSDDDDDNVDFEEKADYSELIELTEDASLTVEQLRQKYYGGNGEEKEDEDGDGGGGKLPAVKKTKFDESDDDECGF